MDRMNSFFSASKTLLRLFVSIRGCTQIVFEVVGGDADEAEEEVIERAVEVVFAVGAREDGAWTAGVGEVGHGC